MFKYLIGNKTDLTDEIKMEKEDVIKYAIDNGFRCFFTSCLDGTGVKEFVDDLVNQLIKKYNVY